MNETPIKNDQQNTINALRTAQRHHVQLTMMADQKANIILGAFLIFITITQTILDKQDSTYIPVLVFSLFFILSAFFALLVIKPRFREKKALPNSSPGNLLFFGSFLSLSQQEYIDTLNKELQNDTDAREMLMKDIYQIGEVLMRKYNNLRLSYLCLALSIASLLITMTVTQLF